MSSLCKVEMSAYGVHTSPTIWERKADTMKEDITMSHKEVDRIAILERMVRKEIKQKKAAQILDLSVRQVRRLVKRYTREGSAGIVHKLRGIPSNNKTDETILKSALDTIQARYNDFGPTLAHEKLVELHTFPYSRETLRQEMASAGIWRPKRTQNRVVHTLRERRSCFGELVQADGSPHPWFEARGASCTLLVFIDDATGRLMHVQFVEAETTNDYFAGLTHYIEEFGKPLALYVDRHSIFKITRGTYHGREDVIGQTQFGRACTELSIELICANSAQAKGRVERSNQTLQDRLVKELRLLGISSMEEGNTYLPTFRELYNRKFAVLPLKTADVHRPLQDNEQLSEILVQKHARILSSTLTCSYHNRLYQVTGKTLGRALRKARVEILEDTLGQVTIKRHNTTLPYTVMSHQEHGLVVNSKRLNTVVDAIKQQTYIPVPTHPWRRFAYAAAAT